MSPVYSVNNVPGMYPDTATETVPETLTEHGLLRKGRPPQKILPLIQLLAHTNADVMGTGNPISGAIATVVFDIELSI